MSEQKQESNFPWEIKGMFYPERAASLGFSVLEACVIARLTAFTNFGTKSCFYSNSNLMKDFNVSLSSAVRTFNFLEKQQVVFAQLKETSKSKVKQREVFLNLKHELFSNDCQNDHVQNDNGIKKNIDHCQNDNDHVQNDNSTIVKMNTLNRSINNLNKEDRSIKKEIIKEKTENTETHGSDNPENQDPDSMLLPQDLLPEEQNLFGTFKTELEKPSNNDADPQNIAINTLDGINTHTKSGSPLKTSSARSEGVSVKPKRKRNTKNPEFDEQGHKIFYVKDNPPSLEQTADFMRNKANRFFDNLIKDGKATESDKDFLNAINIFDYAENCLNWYETRGWAQNNGDLLKDWAATCARWIGKDLNTEWSKYVRYRQFKHNSSGSNSGGYQRTYGETLDDFQGRVINQINRIGQGMFGNQNPELEYGQHNILNDGGNQSK